MVVLINHLVAVVILHLDQLVLTLLLLFQFRQVGHILYVLVVLTAAMVSQLLVIEDGEDSVLTFKDVTSVISV